MGSFADSAAVNYWLPIANCVEQTSYCRLPLVLLVTLLLQNRQQTDRQTEKQTDRQAEKRAARLADRQTNINRNEETGGQIGPDRHNGHVRHGRQTDIAGRQTGRQKQSE
jgi:hypothetical protein